MQGAVGIDRQLSKVMTGNITYLYSRGVHMYLTDNASAAGNFPIDNLLSNTYPATPISPPAENDMQFQSGGVYRQNQIIASLTARYSHFSIFSFYTYNNARGRHQRGDLYAVGRRPCRVRLWTCQLRRA